MKHGYIALVLLASVAALVYGLLNQLDGELWLAFGYVCLVLFGSTTMYLVGWKFSHELDMEQKPVNTSAANTSSEAKK